MTNPTGGGECPAIDIGLTEGKKTEALGEAGTIDVVENDRRR